MQKIPDITIGVERANHKRFDDVSEIAKLQSPIKISFLKIQYNKDHVTGIKIKYKGADGKQIKGTCSLKIKLMGGLFSGTKKEKFVIADDDIIKEFYGFVGTEINQFGFKTYKGVNQVCGVQKGVSFSHHVPLHTFISARGTFDKYLDFIAFRVVPLSPEQLKMLGLKAPEQQQVVQPAQAQVIPTAKVIKVVNPPPPVQDQVIPQAKIIKVVNPPPPVQDQVIPQAKIIKVVNPPLPPVQNQSYDGDQPLQYPPAWLYPPPGPGKNLAPGPYQYPPRPEVQQY